MADSTLHLKSWRKRAGLTLDRLSDGVGLSSPTLSSIERGKQGYSADTLSKLSDFFGCGIGDLFSPPPFRVPVVAYVGAGAEVIALQQDDSGQNLDTVEAPVGAPEAAEAVIVRGDSMWPLYRDGNVLIYWDQRKSPDDFIGEPCVIALADGRQLVKIVKRGSTPSVWNLESFNAAPIEDVRLIWAARIEVSYRTANW